MNDLLPMLKRCLELMRRIQWQDQPADVQSDALALILELDRALEKMEDALDMDYLKEYERSGREPVGYPDSSISSVEDQFP